MERKDLAQSTDRNHNYLPYTEPEEESPNYIPPHQAYLGITGKFKRGDAEWKTGDPLFVLNESDREQALKDIKSTEDVFSSKGRKSKERSFFAHIYEGDDTGGLHHRAEAITPRKIVFIERSKRYLGDRGAFRIDVLIDNILKKDNILFPDNWSRDDVYDCIIEAYLNATYLGGNTFIGKDKYGFPVSISINDADFTIQTAMPNYPKSE